MQTDRCFQWKEISRSGRSHSSTLHSLTFTPRCHTKVVVWVKKEQKNKGKKLICGNVQRFATDSIQKSRQKRVALAALWAVLSATGVRNKVRFFSRPSQVSKHSPTNYARREKGRRRRRWRRWWWWGGGKQRGGCSAKFLRVEKQKEKWNETIEPRARALSPSSTTALMWKLPAWPPEEKRRRRRKRGKGGRFTQNEKERFASLRVFLTNGSPFGVH